MWVYLCWHVTDLDCRCKIQQRSPPAGRPGLFRPVTDKLSFRPADRQSMALLTAQNALCPLWLPAPVSGHVFACGTERPPYCVCGMNYECYCITVACFWGISLQHLPREQSMNTFPRPRPLGSDTVKLACLRLFMVIQSRWPCNMVTYHTLAASLALPHIHAYRQKCKNT